MAANWMPTSRISRAVTPTKLILEGAGAAAIAKARLLRGGDTAEMTADLAADPRLARTAERLARELGEMKGAAMKLGQILSFIDVGMLPPAYRDAFAALQADAPPMPYEMVEQVIESELGAPPEELFTHFSRQPIASASIGQVHMAHRGGEELVLKVQYPGVTKAIEADLRNAALFALLARVVGRLLAGIAGKIDTTAVIEELRTRITEELDYRIEARNQQAFAELWRDDPAVRVPDVVSELSTKRVLTSRYADGNRWNYALEAPSELRNRWGTAIARFQWVSLFRDGFTNLDPHPGNYLFHEDGTVTFLDFGACQRFDASQLGRFAGLIDAVVVDSDEAIVNALVDFGLVTSPGSTTFDHSLITRPVRLAVEPAMHEDQPFRFTRNFVADQVGQAVRLRFGTDELRLLQQLDVPVELPMVLRITLGTAGILSQLDTAVDFRAVIEEALAGPVH
jgi:predicted unusual protein kinase regulating ubiquinone biosynthesis (AarF/ABC1/UbiB family)